MFRRISGSHHITAYPPIHSPHLQSVSVLVHGNRTLSIGVHSKLMKKTGITDEDLQKKPFLVASGANP